MFYFKVQSRIIPHLHINMEKLQKIIYVYHYALYNLNFKRHRKAKQYKEQIKCTIKVTVLKLNTKIRNLTKNLTIN